MAELDGGQRAISPGLMVYQALRYVLHILSESEWGCVGGGDCDCSGISTALGIEASHRRLSNPLSPTL